MKKYLLIAILHLFFVSNVFATNHTINLVVGYKTVYFAGKPRKAIAVNNQIPAPTLHFKEGDRVSINVYNCLDEETAIHWHGILVPWQMDGVLGVNQRGIKPGQSFHYEFILKQAGTYWYHAHAGFQEQQGLYGAFLIDPPKAPTYKYTKDYVVVLSEWSNTHPDQIFANLKKDGDYFSPRFPLQPSLAKFIHDYQKANAAERKRLIDDYKIMQQMRMSIYDFTDVAFDAYLLNGMTKCNPWRGLVKVGDVVRLRFIGAPGTTLFRIKIPHTTMQMVHAQGNDVVPYTINDFTIAPGETYDVLVKIQKDEPYIIYTESADTLGTAIGALVTSPYQSIDYRNITPFPEPLPVTREMMTNMMMSGMDHGSMSGMKMGMKHAADTGMQHTSQMSSASSMKPHHSEMKDMSTKMEMKKTSTKSHSSHSDSKQSIQMNSGAQMSKDMPMDHSMHRQKKSSSPNQVTESKAVVSKPEPNSVTPATAINPGMQMDKAMPMDHSMHKKSEEAKSNTTTEQAKTSTMPADHQMKKSMPMDHAKHSMEMKSTSKTSNKMRTISKTSMAKMPSDHKGHGAMAKDMQMKHDMSSMRDGMAMDHAMHSMPTESTIIGDSIISPKQAGDSKTTPGTKYENLTAAVETNDPNKPIKGVIKMELFGYMDRFIWFINGLPEYKAHPIILEPGQRYRFVFTNTSMMHHPMHIHGHWFILRKGLGSYDPLLHTIDVAPGATIVADIDTDASGQWFFHCHLLYHMFAGMSRNFQYSSIIEITQGRAHPQNIIKDTKYYNRPIVRVDEARPIDTSLVKHPMAHPMGLFLATFLDVGTDPFKNVQKITYKGLYGPDYNKLELLIEDAEIDKGVVENADLDIFYWRLISQFWAVKGGVNYFYRPAPKPYWQPGIGIEGLMPYFIDTDIRAYYYGGSAKLDVELSRDTQLTNNFFLRLGIRSILASKTVPRAQIGSGLNQMRYVVRPYYRLMPGLNAFIEYEYEKNYGAFRTLQRNAGEPSSENTLTFGLGFIF